MKKRSSLTEAVFILDRSGSMQGLEKDTIGGFNAMIAKQRAIAGSVRITTVLFDDRYEVLHDRLPLEQVPEMTSKDYYVRGSTALLDAVGMSIARMVRAQRRTAEKADHVLFVITTDGMENASREYHVSEVRRMIAEEREKYGWEFLFLGANMDAVKEAASFGIDPSRAADYVADSRGTGLNYDAVGCALSSLRANRIIENDWSEQIRQDHARRSGH